MNQLLPVEILGCGYNYPERVVTNLDLEKVMETNDAWIVERTGIKERRFVEPDQAMSDLSIPAAKQAIAHAGIDPAEVDLVIVATSTPDMLMPATAAIVAHAVGATRAAAFDMEAACTGFVTGLIVAQQFLTSGTYRTALVIGGDVLSKFLNWNDRGTAILFGDGAGAVVLRGAQREGFLANYMGANGAGADLIRIPLGSRQPPSAEAIADGSHGVTMVGREVYKFAVEIVPKSIQEVLSRAGLGIEDVSHFILHQANLRIIEAAAKRLGVGMDRMIVNIDRMANTSAGTVPLALGEAVEKGTIRQGDLVCMVGFGSGLTWASTLVRWTSDRPLPSK